MVLSVCPCGSVHVCVCAQATYMNVHACQLGEQIWIERSWTWAEMKLLCLEAVSQRVEKLVLWARCEKLLTQIYFWLYNERWTGKGLAGSVGEYKAKKVMGEVERGV